MSLEPSNPLAIRDPLSLLAARTRSLQTRDHLNEKPSTRLVKAFRKESLKANPAGGGTEILQHVKAFRKESLKANPAGGGTEILQRQQPSPLALSINRFQDRKDL